MFLYILYSYSFLFFFYFIQCSLFKFQTCGRILYRIFFLLFVNDGGYLKWIPFKNPFNSDVIFNKYNYFGGYVNDLYIVRYDLVILRSCDILWTNFRSQRDVFSNFALSRVHFRWLLWLTKFSFKTLSLDN